MHRVRHADATVAFLVLLLDCFPPLFRVTFPDAEMKDSAGDGAAKVDATSRKGKSSDGKESTGAAAKATAAADIVSKKSVAGKKKQATTASGIAAASGTTGKAGAAAKAGPSAAPFNAAAAKGKSGAFRGVVSEGKRMVWLRCSSCLFFTLFCFGVSGQSHVLRASEQQFTHLPRFFCVILRSPFASPFCYSCCEAPFRRVLVATAKKE